MKRKTKAVHKQENLFVLPQTIHAVEQQLAEHFRNEEWFEALDKLEWLLSIPDCDFAKLEQWKSIQRALFELVPSEETNEPPVNENELYSQMMRDKSTYDPTSVKRCFQVLWNNPSVESQLIAIDQLTYMVHESIDHELIRWLAEKARQTQLQFRVLLALKKRGWNRDVVVPGHSSSHMINPIELPDESIDWPWNIRLIGQGLSEWFESDYPSFLPLIQSFWQEWIHRIYLEPLYQDLIKLKESESAIWTEAIFREAILAWTGEESKEGIRTDHIKCEIIRKRLRLYFQPYGS